MVDLKRLYDAILKGNGNNTQVMAKQAIAENCNTSEITIGTIIL